MDICSALIDLNFTLRGSVFRYGPSAFETSVGQIASQMRLGMPCSIWLIALHQPTPCTKPPHALLCCHYLTFIPPLSTSLAMGRKKSSNKTSKEPQKRGNPGIFQGGPLTVLDGWVPEYIKSRGNRSPFWAKFFGEWRTLYPPLDAAEQKELSVLRARLGIKAINIDLPNEGDSSLVPLEEEESAAQPVPAADAIATSISAEGPAPDTSSTANCELSPAAPVVETDTNSAVNCTPAAPVVETDANSAANRILDPAAPVVETEMSSSSVTATAIPPAEDINMSDSPVTIVPASSMETDTSSGAVATTEPVVGLDASGTATATVAPVVEGATNAPITSHDSKANGGNIDAATHSPQATSSSRVDVEKASSPEPASTEKKKKKNKNKNQRSEADNILIARGATDERLKTWFGTRAVKEKIVKNDDAAWSGLMSHFNKDHGKAPRRVPDFKVYGGQEEFQSKIDARIAERFGDDSEESRRLCQHVDVARELFEEESDETKKKIHEAADALYESRREEFEKRVSGEGLTKKEDIPVLREQMGAKLKALFEAIANATNTRISFVAIGYNDTSDDDAFFCNILTGTTPGPNPQKFNEWDPVGYKMHHILSFAEFVKACSRLEKGYTAAPPEHPAELVSACDEAADISNPTVGDSPDVASSSLPTTTVPTAMASSSSSSTQPHKRSSKEIDSGDDTPHSPTPELSSDDDQNIPKDSVDYGECGIKLLPGRRMGKFLAAELRNTSRQERTKKMLVFSKYTQKELNKEEQAAKQRFVTSMMDEDSEDDDEVLPVRSAKGKGKGKAKGKGKGKAKGKRKKLEDMELEDDEDDEPTPNRSKRQRIEDHTQNTEEHIIPISNSIYATPPSTQLPASTTTPDTEAGARVTATGTGNAQASASALISAAGDADVYATARSTGGATSTARAVARGAGQRSDSVTSANINVDTQSAPPSPAKAGLNPEVPGFSSTKPTVSQEPLSSPAKASLDLEAPHCSSTKPAVSQDNSPCPSPPPSTSLAKSTCPPRSSTRSSTQSSNITSRSSLSSSASGTPTWVQQMKDFLLSDISSSRWVQSIEAWEDLERAYGFATSRQTLPTVKRPDAVNFWTKRARRLADPPPATQGPKFGKEVSEWWDSMMPSWRRKVNGQWARDGEGDWGPVRCPGLNGLLSIMACLRWWLVQESSGSVQKASRSWQALFDDVCWVMEELKKSEEAPARKKTRSE
ncbi:SERTA domain-containing protein 3 [Paramarasmius palmivorus]|uniref:SERTA domain-containing protein 3 n=1 Tax=Paramarasmius palmivorus TaxID=297713 RepID=A0AAW0B171_9AGAR